MVALLAIGTVGLTMATDLIILKKKTLGTPNPSIYPTPMRNLMVLHPRVNTGTDTAARKLNISGEINPAVTNSVMTPDDYKKIFKNRNNGGLTNDVIM